MDATPAYTARLSPLGKEVADFGIPLNLPFSTF
jgi:hypothetical protein